MEESAHKINTNYVVAIAIAASLGGLLFGYDTAVISGAIGFLRTKFSLTAAQMGWAASSALIGSIIGCVFAGPLSDWLGRKKILILAALLFAISAIGSALATNLSMFVIYRIIGGCGVGTASMITPLYISEVSPAKSRGKMVSFNQFAIVFGMFVIYFVNYFIAKQGPEAWNISTGWRWMFGSEAIPAFIFLISLFFVPESPRWLVGEGKKNKALATLTKIGGDKKANAQIREIRKTIEKETGDFRMLFKPNITKIVIIGVIIAVLQQAVGINVILYYAPEIFKQFGSNVNAALLKTIVVGTFNMGFTVVAMVKVDQLGRKPLLLFGSIGMAFCLTSIGLLAFFQQQTLWSLVFIVGYISCFALSVGPVVWVILSEIFPTTVRGRAMSIATVFLWGTNWLISQTFPMIDENPWLVKHFHHGFSFWLYALMCLIMFFFVWKFMPETKGKSLEQIEQEILDNVY